MNLTITEHLLVGENILVITVTKIKNCLDFSRNKSWAILGQQPAFPVWFRHHCLSIRLKFLMGKASWTLPTGD